MLKNRTPVLTEVAQDLTNRGNARACVYARRWGDLCCACSRVNSSAGAGEDDRTRACVRVCAWAQVIEAVAHRIDMVAEML